MVRVIGWSEALGGGAGLLVLPVAAWQQARAGAPPGLRMPAVGFAMAAVAFAAAAAAGVLLLRRRRAGVRASAAVQALQVVQFGVPGTFVYQYAAGIHVLLAVGQYGLRFSPGINAAFVALPVQGEGPWWAGVNLFALAAVVVLARELAAPDPESMAGDSGDRAPKPPS